MALDRPIHSRQHLPLLLALRPSEDSRNSRGLNHRRTRWLESEWSNCPKRRKELQQLLPRGPLFHQADQLFALLV